MHYYTHNIGEFAAKTRFMSPEEIGIYVILKDEYLLSGMRLACDRIATLMPPECDGSLTRVLKRFFVEEDGFYVCREFDEELDNFKDRGSINAQNAKKRWEKRKQASDSDANVCEPHATCTDSHANECLTNNQEPITNNQEPITSNQKPEKEEARSKPARRPAPKLVKPEGVSDGVWDEWQALKRKLCKSCSQRMVDAIDREAQRAGMTVEEAMVYQLEKGWKGFEAEWVLRDRGQFSDQPKSQTKFVLREKRQEDRRYGL